MKHFVLLALMATLTIRSFSQATYTTATSGNFNVGTTWSGDAPGAPPTSGNCNCKIVVATGHTLTFSATTTLDNVKLILDGPGSIVTFSASVDVTFGGTSSIDIQDAGAQIQPADANNNINLGGQEIYAGNMPGINSATPGVVAGLTSASSERLSGPGFQNGVLPVKLSAFDVSKNDNSITLAWTTATEINSSHFDIQRSNDGKEWSTIGSVNAAGSVSVEQNYSYKDETPGDGTNYYRLKIVDADASAEYSPIKSASVTIQALNVTVGPNPASTLLNVRVSSPGRDTYRLRLVNRSGQVVFDQKYSGSSAKIELNVSNYPDGSYFLEVSKGAQSRQINKVMIVRK